MEPTKITLSELEGLWQQYEEFRKSWKFYEVLGKEIAIYPDGTCEYFEANARYSSFSEAIEILLEDAIDFFESCIKTYSRIVEDFDNNGREYGGYFSKKRIANFREVLKSYPGWIKNLKKGLVVVKCKECHENSDIPSVGLDITNPPNCLHCGSKLDFEIPDPAKD